MEYTTYKIQQGDTLESIAERQGCTVKQLVQFHNQHAEMTQQIYGTHIPLHIEKLYINDVPDKTEFNINEISFDQKARYRCEQFNATKVEDNITFHCNTKKEYTLTRDVENNLAKVKLIDYFFKVNPENLSLAIESTKELEFQKENVLFKLGNGSNILEIQNFEEIKNHWINFKPKYAKTQFYQEIAKVNAGAADDILKGGDIEFKSQENLKKTFEKILFYHVIFNDFTSNTKNILKFSSQIFLNITIEVELQTTLVKEDDERIEFRTVGTLMKDKIDNEVLKSQYDQFYKPLIEYGFSEYLYEYRTRRTVDKKTGLITSAAVFTKEEVKNNYQFVTQFDLKQIDY